MRVKNQMKNSKRKAFTLVELLVVIAIIGILFVVLISKVDFATDKAKATGVQTDFRSYQLAIETVARENAGLSTLVDDEAGGEEKYAALEAALNKNLDPKLRVEIDDNGKISTKAKDPWKEEYLGAYLAPDEDGTVKDRGAIIMYSKGPNLKLGSTAEITNGVVNVTIESGKETEGADDYAISTIYTYVNGYGEIQTTTEGFSNDIEGNETNVDSNGADGNTTPTPNPTPGEGEQGGTQEPVQLEAGLYDANNNLLADWDTLVSTYGMDVEKDYTYSSYNTDESSPYYVLTNISELRKGIRLVFPNSVNKIGNYAFYKMRQLSIDVGVNVATIGDFAFYDSFVYSLTGAQVQDGEMIIPDCVINIGENAFAFNDEFDTLVIGSNVSYIGNSAFFNCSSLIDITLGENIIGIGSRAFGNCYNLACDLIIPNNVITIGDEAFDNCSGLTGDIVIPDSVISIGDRAFFNCYGFTGNLAISESVEYIGYDTFAFCSNLSSISVDVANITYHSDSNCLIETQAKILLLGCRNSIIPTDGSVTSLVNNAFACCLSLTNIVIPEDITNIGCGVFSDCRGLESITIESNVLIDYPQDFLYNCNSLTAIYVNPSLLNNYKIAPGWSEYADIFCAYEVTISCPAGGEHFYRNPGIYTADGELVVSWDDLVQTYNLDIETNYNNTLGNANNYLTNKSSLQYILKTHFADAVTNGVIVSIGNVTGIGNYVFFGMDSSLSSLLYSGIDLLEVIIPSSVTSIGQNTFANSVNIKILYGGTMTQWNSISLGTSWNDGQSNPMIIHCTDGDKEIEITEEESGTGTSGCVSADTLILLADGTTKRIDEITYDDVVMVWNFETGTYDAAPISIIFYHGHKEYDILNLRFSDGTVLKVINDHGLYSVSENNYVYISINNVEDYIGHQFVKYNGNAYTTVTLVEYHSTVEYTGSYCLQTAGTNNYIAEGMFSLTKPDVEGWFDYFVIGDDMKYDEAQMQTDIAKYGLYTYEDFVHTGITYEQFLAFNGPYLKVLVGRGVLTFERIEALIGQYL